MGGSLRTQRHAVTRHVHPQHTHTTHTVSCSDRLHAACKHKAALWSTHILPTFIVFPPRVLSLYHALFQSPIARLLPPLHFILVTSTRKWRQESSYMILALFMMGCHTPWPGLVPMQTSGQTVMDRICPLSRCSYDTPHQPPAFTDQDIQCHPQDLTQHMVKYTRL